MRKFYTVKEMSDLYGPIAFVRQEGQFVSIQLAGGEGERDCDMSKRGKCATAIVRPRIKIKGF